MNNNIHVNTNVSCETGSTRQRARRGTTKCAKSQCMMPRVESSAYCREHRNQAQREYRKRLRQELEAFRAQQGTWVEPA